MVACYDPDTHGFLTWAEAKRKQKERSEGSDCALFAGRSQAALLTVRARGEHHRYVLGFAIAQDRKCNFLPYCRFIEQIGHEIIKVLKRVSIYRRDKVAACGYPLTIDCHVTAARLQTGLSGWAVRLDICDIDTHRIRW